MGRGIDLLQDEFICLTLLTSSVNDLAGPGGWEIGKVNISM